MKYLLDTNICVYIIRGKSAKVLQELSSHPVTDVAVSAITVAELQFGVEKSSQPAHNQQALNQFLVPFTTLDFDYDAALEYGRIRARLEGQGAAIGSLDTLIAAQAVSRSLTLVTNNTGEFSRVSGLTMEDWST
jgi:tRNA(fMet)-specific endonuclease VapC